MQLAARLLVSRRRRCDALCSVNHVRYVVHRCSAGDLVRLGAAHHRPARGGRRQERQSPPPQGRHGRAGQSLQCTDAAGAVVPSCIDHHLCWTFNLQQLPALIAAAAAAATNDRSRHCLNIQTLKLPHVSDHLYNRVLPFLGHNDTRRMHSSSA